MTPMQLGCGPVWHLLGLPLAMWALVAGCGSAEPTCSIEDCDGEQAVFLADQYPVCAEKIASSCPDPASGCGCEIRSMVEPEFLVCEEDAPGGVLRRGRRGLA